MSANTPLEWLRRREQRLVDAGLLDPNEPTEYAHRMYLEKSEGEFTPWERAQIRLLLGMAPFDTDDYR